jgi:hypothetical protein
VPIPAETVAVLKAHRKSQLAGKMSLGPDYSDDGLVFCGEDSTRPHAKMFSPRHRRHGRGGDQQGLRARVRLSTDRPVAFARIELSCLAPRSLRFDIPLTSAL